MDHAMSDTARRFISQLLLVFLAMLLIISGIWGSPTSLAYRHLFLDSMMIVCLMRKPFSQSHKRLANGVDFCLAALVRVRTHQMRVGSLTRMDVVTGTIYMGILLELARRVAGMPMVVIALFFFSQNCFAQYLPGIFRRANMKYTSMLDFVGVRTRSCGPTESSVCRCRSCLPMWCCL